MGRPWIATIAATLGVCAAGAGLIGHRESEAKGDGNASKAKDPAPRYFPSSFFTKPLPEDTVIDRESDELVRQLRNLAFGVAPQTQINCRHAVTSPAEEWTPAEQASCQPVITRAGIVAENGSTVYRVGGDQPRVPVAIGKANPDLRRVMAAGVPIPPGAQPSLGSDRRMIIWQPQTDTMWELWKASLEADGWHAANGGRILNVSKSPGHYRDLVNRRHPGRFREQHRWGETASSIATLPGLIRLDQLRAGRIRHALVFATWTNKPGAWVYPAQNTDGRCRGQYCSAIPQGARFRLGADYKVSQLQNPFVRMLARAVQDYGMVLDNTTGGGVAIYAEGWRQYGIGDPYSGPGGFFTADPRQTHPTQFMRDFPWEKLKMLKRGTPCHDVTVECPAPDWWPAKRK
jgi:hypothetical protein